MKLLVHDYSGHPFQAQLSREFARRGHTVEHVHCGSYVSGKGHVVRSRVDPQSLTFVSLGLGRSFDKYAVARRLSQECAYARTFLSHVGRTRPDVVVMCNVPLVAHALIERKLKATGIRTVFWHQDVYSHAIGVEARRRLGPVGAVIARTADRLERNIARRADAVVAISDQFVPVHRRWGVGDAKVHVVPNWGPLDEISPRPRDNEWAREHGLVGRPVLVYSGTLGLKHDPDQLLALLQGVRTQLPTVVLVVVSDGPAADRLRASREPGLLVLPFQPFERLPEVLAAGDVLVAILEPDASNYSVPSKTLTYLCAGRPVLGLMPEGNPASAVIRDSGGIAVDLATTEMAAAAQRVTTLLVDQSELHLRGRQSRAYAERSFDIERIADLFEPALGVGQDPANVAEPVGASEDISALKTSEVG
jgi:glycosyltransferase involved in cell wall biosynthesis